MRISRPVARRRREAVLPVLSRRAALGALAGAAALLAAACSGGQRGVAPAPAAPQAPRPKEKLDLAFCSQLLCILPFEVAVKEGFFGQEGLEVNLVYMRGGPPAVQALLSESLDFIGTTMDLVVQTAAQGKRIVMVTSTSRLPFFALVTAPGTAAQITSPRDLVGKKVGVANLGATDHLLLQYLVKKNGGDPQQVEYVALGPNLYQALLAGQVDAAMVQEPALTLTAEKGGRVLVNFMRLKEAREHLGSAYQFMGLITRPDVIEKRLTTLQGLSRGLRRAAKFILENPGERIVQAAPQELIAGGDIKLLGRILDGYKNDLYPVDGVIPEDAVQTVIEVQKSSGVVDPNKQFRLSDLFTNQYLTPIN